MSIQKNATTQLRVEESAYKGKAYIHIREWIEKDGAFIPTKRGVSFGPEFVKDLINELTILQTIMAKTVPAIEKETVYSIADSVKSAEFNRKRIYKTEQEAHKKFAPDGYFIFKCDVEKGCVIKATPMYKRVNGAWRARKSESK